MKFFFVSLFTGLCMFVQAQSDQNTLKVPGRTSFYAELGGPGILFSANIDSRFKASSLGWGFRAGLGFVTADEVTDGNNGYPVYQTRSVVTVPVQVNYVFGKAESPHTFEVGAGATYVGKKLDILNFDEDGERTNVFATASFMYRRQPIGGGFTWRIGFTPIIANGFIQPSGAVGVGYNF